MTLFSAALLLFLVMDPVGNIPVFLSTLKNVEKKRRKFIILRELIIALLVLIGFLFGGRYVLQALQISDPSLTIAGGIILFLIALRMIFPGFRGGGEEEMDGEPLIVPLAIPLVAGPSAMATVMLMMSQDPSRWQDWLIALTVAWFVSGVILLLANALSRFLGKRGLVAIERLMGMILITISVQMMLGGIKAFLDG